MISQLAEEIYANSIQLKKYNTRNLRLKKKRILLENDLIALQSLTEKLIFELNNDNHYSSNDFELAFFMYKTIAGCLVHLASNRKRKRETIKRYIWGFHNLPRAFFSSQNPMKISLVDAWEYYKPYLKQD